MFFRRGLSKVMLWRDIAKEIQRSIYRPADHSFTEYWFVGHFFYEIDLQFDLFKNNRFKIMKR